MEIAATAILPHRPPPAAGSDWRQLRQLPQAADHAAASQDPLSPLDATQFTEQLVQFTGVEQAIKTNDVLGQLVALVRSDQVARAVDYLGAEVEANGQTVRLDGRAGERPLPARPASRRGRDQHLQRRRPPGQGPAGHASPGIHTVPWDGRDQNGAPCPMASTGSRWPRKARRRRGAGEHHHAGVVDGVELQGDRLMLSVAGVLLPLDAVTTIRRPPATA